jgi:hypothetical protein
MIKRMFAIQLDGTVSLRRWTAVLSAWHKSLSEISKEVGQDKVLSISIDGLTYGSAITEVSAEFDTELAAVQFTQTYDSLSRGLRNGNIIDFPVPLQKFGKKLIDAAKIDNGDGFILSSETGDFAVSLDSKIARLDVLRAAPDQAVAYGSVSGRLQSLSSRGSLRVVVFDEINDKAVRCTITSDQHERVRKLWDQHVTVHGLVNRDPITGRPLSVKNITSIDPSEPHVTEDDDNDKFAWTKARGALKHVHPELSSEELIRMVRDA